MIGKIGTLILTLAYMAIVFYLMIHYSLWWFLAFFLWNWRGTRHTLRGTVEDPPE